MSKDFVQIADDVISGVKLLREGAPEPMRSETEWSNPSMGSGRCDGQTLSLRVPRAGELTFWQSKRICSDNALLSARAKQTTLESNST